MESTRQSPDDPPLAIPAARPPRLGPWRLARRLGKGGMGAVYEGLDESTGERRAIKTLLAVPGAQFFEEDLRRFQREADLVTRLSHPHIVSVEAANLDHTPPYLVMELLPGGTLKDRLRQGALPVAEALAIGAKLCDAVAHAHELGALHRDLKPANVLFDAAGEPKLADFGLGRDTGVSVERLTQTGEVLGTPAYMAPEQTIDASRVDARSDVHALGALLYVMLSGRPPFAGESLADMLSAVRHSQPTPLRDDRPDLPLAVEAICQRAMAKDPDDRYPSAAAMGEAIRRVAGPDEPSSPGGRPPRARGWLVPLVALTALGASVLVGGLLSGRSGSAAVPTPTSNATLQDLPASAEPPPRSTAPAQTSWALAADQHLTYELTVSPARPGELELERASLSLVLSMTVTSLEPPHAQLQASVLRVRAWADPLQGRATRYDSVTQPSTPGPTESLLSQAHGAELAFTLDVDHGEVSHVAGRALPTDDLLDEPAAWPARALADLLSPEGFEACWDGLARLAHSAEAPGLGKVTYRRERPRTALREDPAGLVWRLSQVETRTLAHGDVLAGRVSPGTDTDRERVAIRRLGSAWLTNAVQDPDKVLAGWTLVEPPPIEFPEPHRLLKAARLRTTLRATPWGPLVYALSDGERVGSSPRVEAGFRLVCLGGGLAWCRDADLERDHSRGVVVTDPLDQAYVYPTRIRKPGTSLGIAPLGTVYPLLDKQTEGGVTRILIPYLDTKGWILLKDARILQR